jgi:hypothetical protein
MYCPPAHMWEGKTQLSCKGKVKCTLVQALRLCTGRTVKCTVVQALRFCTGHAVKCTLVQALRLCTGRTVKCTLVQALRLCTGHMVKCTLVQALRLCTGHMVKCTLLQALRLCTGRTVKCTLVQALRLCTSRTVKCTLVQVLRLCTGRTAHRGSRGIALPFHYHGTRRWWGVTVTPRTLFTHWKNPVPIIKEAGWASGPVWTGAENIAPTGIRSPDRPPRSRSLYRLSYPAHKLTNIYISTGSSEANSPQSAI